mmetsp:Transcript_40657/g.121272  ORF Transcript_40657/g.121272 Transcript_40657/m.121272 type:complete len:169 (+) Transcript_40657:248-754(+)
MGSALDDDQVLRLFKETDLDGNGSIDFQEFMTTNVRRVKEECEKRLAAAYKHYEAKVWTQGDTNGVDRSRRGRSADKRSSHAVLPHPFTPFHTPTHRVLQGPITPAKLPQVMLLTGISDFHKIEAELAKTRKDGDADVSLERAMELMWHGITAQQWLEMTNLPPVLDD